MRSNRHAGQYNLRGKKYLGLICKCCEVQDFRSKYFEKLEVKEIQNYKKKAANDD